MVIMMIVRTSSAPSDSTMLLMMRRMLEMQRQHSSQWNREAIDLIIIIMMIIMMMLMIMNLTMIQSSSLSAGCREYKFDSLHYDGGSLFNMKLNTKMMQPVTQRIILLNFTQLAIFAMQVVLCLINPRGGNIGMELWKYIWEIFCNMSRHLKTRKLGKVHTYIPTPLTLVRMSIMKAWIQSK